MNWFALHVMTGEELNVQKRLQQSDDPIRTLVPLRKLKERKGGVVRERTRILIPSYVFVCLSSLQDPETYYRLIGAAGVIRILGNGSPIPHAEMTPILRWCQEDELIGFSTVELGQQAKVKSGPLAGFEGQIVRIDRRKQRATIRITLFEREHEMDFGIEIIQTNQASE